MGHFACAYLVADFARYATSHSHQDGVMAFENIQDANFSIYDTTTNATIFICAPLPVFVSTDQSDNAHPRNAADRGFALSELAHPTSFHSPTHIPFAVLCLLPRNLHLHHLANLEHTILSTNPATADPTAQPTVPCHHSGRSARCSVLRVLRSAHSVHMGLSNEFGIRRCLQTGVPLLSIRYDFSCFSNACPSSHTASPSSL
jgi:hypothetical protein